MRIWIARDKDSDELWLYSGRPLIDGERYKPNLEKENFRSVELPIEWFPEVTFENSPMEAELELKKDDDPNLRDIIVKHSSSSLIKS